VVAPSDARPQSNVYTFLLIVSFCFMIAGVVFTMMEMNQSYDAEFGGLMSKPPARAPEKK